MITLPIQEFINLIVTITAGIMAVTIILQAPRRQLNITFFLLLLIYVYMGVVHFLYASGIAHPAIYAANAPVACYTGLVMYHFSKSLASNTYRITGKDLKLYIPGLFFLVYTVFRLSIPSWRAELIRNTHYIDGKLVRESLNSIPYYLYMVSIIIPLLASYRVFFQASFFGDPVYRFRNRVVFFSLVPTAAIFIVSAMILPLVGFPTTYTLRTVAATISLMLITFTVFRQKYWNEERMLRMLEAQESDLRDKNNRMSELMDARDHFLASVSHELRTPLTLIINPLHNLISDNRIIQNDRVRKILQMILRNARRVLREVNHLLDMSVLEFEKKKPEPVLFQPSVFIEKYIEMFAPLAEEKGLRIRSTIENGETTAFTDMYLLERIILNLLSNAVKFTQSGEIYVSFRVQDDVFILDVQDSGQGISLEERSSVFNPFLRSKKPDKSIMGAGIGLSIAKNAARIMGGDLTLESLSKGSLFRLIAPLQISTPTPVENIRRDIVEIDSFMEDSFDSSSPLQLELLAAKRKPVLDDSAGWNHERKITEKYEEYSKNKNSLEDKAVILIVEDDLELLDYLSELLMPHYQIRTATHGGMALDELKKFKTDLVITDLMMPVMDGLELISHIRQLSGEEKNIPVLMLTARVSINGRIQGLSAGANDFMEKPFHDDELLYRLENLMKNRFHASQVEDSIREKFFTDIHDNFGAKITDLKILASKLHDESPGDLAQMILNKTNEIAVSLRKRINNLEDRHSLEKNLLEGMQMIILRRYASVSDRSFLFKPDPVLLSEKITLADRHKAESMFGILNEIINNDIKYGHGKSTWEISRMENQDLLIRFQAQSDYQSPSAEKGHGTRTLHMRARTIGGTLSTKLRDGIYHLEFQFPLGDSP